MGNSHDKIMTNEELRSKIEEIGKSSFENEYKFSSYVLSEIMHGSGAVTTDCCVRVFTHSKGCFEGKSNCFSLAIENLLDNINPKIEPNEIGFEISGSEENG